MNNVLDFTTKMLGLQGIEVIYTYVNNGIFTVCAIPSAISGICPKCGSTTETIHDVRVQDYMHLPIWVSLLSLFDRNLLNIFGRCFCSLALSAGMYGQGILTTSSILPQQ